MHLGLSRLLRITIYCSLLLVSSFQINSFRQDAKPLVLPFKERTLLLPRVDNNNSPLLLHSSLPPEAEEFFESLDQWAQNTQVRTKHPQRKYLENNLGDFVKDLRQTSPSLALSSSPDKDDSGRPDDGPMSTTVASELSDSSANTVVLDLDLDADLDDDAPFLDTDEYLELCRQSFLDAYQGPDDWSTSPSMDSQPIPMMVTDPSFREGLANFIECETVPSAETTHEAQVIPEDEALDVLLDLLRTNGRNATNYFNASVAEELDRQVFAEESGHQNSNELFRRSLTNATAREEAITERRTRLFRERQAEGTARLESMIQQFMDETVFRDNDDDGTVVNDEKEEQDEDDDLGLEISRCSMCQKMLAASEMKLGICSNCSIELAAKDDGESSRAISIQTEYATNRNGDTRFPRQRELRVTNSPPTDPWFSMVDPETQEVFYWNQETGEMRWESPKVE
jgi:hypothetical protein